MPTAAQSEPSVALTVSPLLLVIPMAEVTAEIRIAPKLGVALTGGIGAVRDPDLDDLIKLYEAGASVRYYATGSFRSGLQLGAEVMYVHATTTADSVRILAEGLAVGPFVGYKWTHSSGFTFDGQLGVNYYTLRADTIMDESNIGPLLNLNVGWSF